MIHENEVFNIGFISKHRGLRGEVELCFTDDCFDTGTADYFVLDMDGILVPFFWEEYRFKNDETAILKFCDVDKEEQARKLVGHRVFYPKKHLAQPSTENKATLSSYKALTGFKVFNQENEELGTIAYVDDSSSNILLSIDTMEGQELLFPFHNDFLLDFDLQERSIRLFIPEELLNLNN